MGRKRPSELMTQDPELPDSSELGCRVFGSRAIGASRREPGRGDWRPPLPVRAPGSAAPGGSARPGPPGWFRRLPACATLMAARGLFRPPARRCVRRSGPDAASRSDRLSLPSGLGAGISCDKFPGGLPDLAGRIWRRLVPRKDSHATDCGFAGFVPRRAVHGVGSDRGREPRLRLDFRRRPGRRRRLVAGGNLHRRTARADSGTPSRASTAAARSGSAAGSRSPGTSGSARPIPARPTSRPRP